MVAHPCATETSDLFRGFLDLSVEVDQSCLRIATKPTRPINMISNINPRRSKLGIGSKVAPTVTDTLVMLFAATGSAVSELVLA